MPQENLPGLSFRMNTAKPLSPGMWEEAPSDEQNADEGNQVSKEVLSWQIEGEEYVECYEQHDGGNGNQACNFSTLSSVIAPTLP